MRLPLQIMDLGCQIMCILLRIGFVCCFWLLLSRSKTVQMLMFLTLVIRATVEGGGGLHYELILKKLVCIGADGASILQGCHNGVTTQVIANIVPYARALHYFGYKTDLALKALFELAIFAAIEHVVATTHAYFWKSPKWFAEFSQLGKLTETLGLKMLRNVPTQWVSLIDPLKRVISNIKF